MGRRCEKHYVNHQTTENEVKKSKTTTNEMHGDTNIGIEVQEVC